MEGAANDNAISHEAVLRTVLVACKDENWWKGRRNLVLLEIYVILVLNVSRSFLSITSL